MKHVSILVPRGHSSIVNIGGTQQILDLVNDMLVEIGRPPAFDVELVGVEPETRQSTGSYAVVADKTISEVCKTDVIIIPAIHDAPELAFERNEIFVPWILDQYKRGADVASFCVGAFFLARTGLLDGKPAATHWRYANSFRAMFPNVKLVDESIMTERDGVYTSGGAYAFLNLVLHLVEKTAGRDIAVLAAKTFSIDIDRVSQSGFIIFEGQKDHGDELVIQAQQYIENNFQERIQVAALADELALSRRSLERRFKQATNNTVTEYAQRVKVEAAKRALETTRKSVSEVMYDVGYADNKAFRSLFRRITGLTPIDYRSKYNRDAVAATPYA